MKKRIVKRTVESITPGEHDVFVWDSEIPGFGVKVTPRGKRVYVLQYSFGGRSRRYTIGRHGVDLTAEEARTEARRLRGLVADGHDPAGEHAILRAVPTLKVFAERYLAEHAAVKKKASSAAEDRRNLRNHVLPVLGTRRVTDITRNDVARLHAAMKDKPCAANRCLALLSKMFTLAEKWCERPDGTNPTRHVEKFRERKIERFLSETELARLGDVLDGAEQVGEHTSVVAAIRLLIFTGCRRNEILTLKWEHVDFERGCLWLPDSKTGAQMVPLGAPAIELLSGLSQIDGNPYVLPGAVRGKHYVALEKAWRRLRGRAGLDDVRLHDLRHSFASTGAAAGESLVLIGALLGHRNTATTARYAHLSNDPLRAAADRIAGRIAGAMRGDPGKVVPLEAQRK
jgi:integrase